MNNDKEKYMYRCIQLAKNGSLYASPNPLVGAVIVHNGTIIGEGYHIRSGASHAEVNAINSVQNKNLLKESTIYVSLEPCSHQGKTPPCVDLIIKEQLPHVVIGCQDPFAKVNGTGINKLRKAGIKVDVGILEKQCLQLISRFHTFHKQQRPYIVLKWAQTADGFIDFKRSNGKPLIISTANTTLITQKRRAEVDAILVGRKTAELDNPSLNVRHWYPKNPLRFVIDKSLKLNPSLKLFDQNIPTTVITEEYRPDVTNLNYLTLDFRTNIPKELMKQLHHNNIQSILVEGGSQLLDSFIKEGLWDEIHVEHSPLLIKEGVAAPNISQLKEYKQDITTHFGRHFTHYSKL